MCVKSQLSDSALNHLVRSLSRGNDPWVCLAMALDLTVYLDDSGHPDDQEAVAVAGWVAQLEQWLLLEEGWGNILREFGIRSAFHRTDFQTGSGDYALLKCRDKERLLYKLINQIRTRVRHGFCSIVPMSDYRQVNASHYLEECLGKPYALAGSMVALDIDVWKQRYARNDNVVVVFEEGSKHKGDLEDVFVQYGFDRPAFREKKKVVALQAADLLAWECFHAFEFDKATRALFTLTRVPMAVRVACKEQMIEACETGPSIPPRREDKNLRVYFKRIPKKLRVRRIFQKPSDTGSSGTRRLFITNPPRIHADDFCHKSTPR